VAKKAAEEEEKRKREAEEREKALNLLRGNQRRGENQEFLKMKLAQTHVEIDRAIENDKSEEQDDLMSLPLVQQINDAYEKKGILAKREDGFFKYVLPLCWRWVGLGWAHVPPFPFPFPFPLPISAQTD
jgi:hypothetical protein